MIYYIIQIIQMKNGRMIIQTHQMISQLLFQWVIACYIGIGCTQRSGIVDFV